VLGPRLVECTRALAELRGRTAQDVMGVTDAMKLRSSMTLFARVAPEGSPFQAVLDMYFAGAADTATEGLLERRDA
jgi:uncharacterized protein (DUF1810 family)